MRSHCDERVTAVEAARSLQQRQPGAKIVIAAIATFAVLMPSLALAQEPVGSGRSCPHGYTSSGSFCVGAGSTAAPNGEGYDLHFENVPVAALAKVILGDILGVGYTIDPRVQGTVSLASGRPVPKSDVLFALENALRLSNVALVPDVLGYRLMPVGEAIGTGPVDVRQ
jgi:type II secretory pathway component GspD/PulD (secretin)